MKSGGAPRPQSSLQSSDAVLLLLFGLLRSGPSNSARMDGWENKAPRQMVTPSRFSTFQRQVLILARWRRRANFDPYCGVMVAVHQAGVLGSLTGQGHLVHLVVSGFGVVVEV